MERNILLMQEIRLQIEKISKNNFDNFIELLERCRKLDKFRYFDTSIKKRLRDDAFSIYPKYEVYLGKIGLEWVAYVIIIMSYSTFLALPILSIDEIFVLDNFKSLGIGTAMFDFCVRKAKNRGCGKIELIVPDGNKKAKKFFELNGSEPTNMTCYQRDPFKIKIGKFPRKMTCAD